jgi:CubicO group peptidase (beta-lactamase class C family)
MSLSSGQDALQALEDGARSSDSDAMLIMRAGETLLDYRRAGPHPGRLEMMSCTKSLVALGIGRLLTQRKITSPDQRVSDFYPEWKQGQKAKITLRMLMNHTSGLQNVPDTRVEIYPAPNGLKLALAAELSDPPGERFSYNNKAANLLAGIIERASGLRMDRYLEQELLTPLGVDGSSWNEEGGYDRAGNPFAMAGWVSTAADAAKIGQLVVQDGQWKGSQLIDSRYVREMLSQSQPFTDGCGLLWWRRAAQVWLHVDAAGLDAFAKAGVAAGPLNKLRALLVRRFKDGAEVRAALKETLGPDLASLEADINARQLLIDDLLVARGSGPVVAYEALGYHGQYIMVVPQVQLVAVRQIGPRPAIPENEPWPYDYADFAQRVLTLGRSLDGSLTG